MSSLKLRRTPTPTEHLASVMEALVDVAENSFFGYVEPIDFARFDELAASVDGWIHASVHFDGAFAGCLHAMLPDRLGRQLFASFLGADGEPSERELFDLIGEFANMVGGTWLTHTCQRRQFNLQHPEVTEPHDARPSPATLDAPVVVSFDDAPLVLWLEFVPEG